VLSLVEPLGPPGVGLAPGGDRPAPLNPPIRRERPWPDQCARVFSCASNFAMTTAGKNRIMIFGPKSDGTYVIEFRAAAGESLAISIPETEAAVIRHFQERMPYGLFVPDVDSSVE
jgi:hypothetical protein